MAPRSSYPAAGGGVAALVLVLVVVWIGWVAITAVPWWAWAMVAAVVAVPLAFGFRHWVRGRPAAIRASIERVDQSLRTAGAAALPMIRVLRVQKEIGRGTKADVEVLSEGIRRDAFFWHTRVRAGSVIVLGEPFGVGWGSHTNREDVHFFGTKDSPADVTFHAVLLAKDVARWERSTGRRLAGSGHARPGR
jgi:hypothetical protein